MKEAVIMSLRDAIKQTTGIGNAFALGYLKGEIYTTICFWLIGFSILSALILGTSWKWVGFSFGLLVGMLLFWILGVIWYSVKILFIYFFQMKKE
jgi:hypothetical protein